LSSSSTRTRLGSARSSDSRRCVTRKPLGPGRKRPGGRPGRRLWPRGLLSISSFVVELLEGDRRGLSHLAVPIIKRRPESRNRPSADGSDVPEAPGCLSPLGRVLALEVLKVGANKPLIQCMRLLNGIPALGFLHRVGPALEPKLKLLCLECH